MPGKSAAGSFDCEICYISPVKTGSPCPFLFDIHPVFNTFAPGELSEWSMEAVLKTVVPQGTGGSNPSLSDSFRHTRNSARAWRNGIYAHHWRGAREAEGDGLLNRCTVTVPRVRIPSSPNNRNHDRKIQHQDTQIQYRCSGTACLGHLLPVHRLVLSFYL